MSNKEKVSEEIDLGQLFALIGNATAKLFRFIGSIFKGIFHLVILFFQFIQKHSLKFAIAGIFGLAIGWYWDTVSKPIYRSSMIVEPNFNSTQQLYNNIQFYNELAGEEEYRTLAASLKISDTEAIAITKIEIEAFSDDNQKLKQFSDFLKTLDSTSRVSLSYKEYLKNFNNMNAKFHKIKLEAVDPAIAKKCQKAIVRSIENNSYFTTQKATNDLNIELSELTVKEQLTQIDSLTKFYQELKILELKKPEGSSGTSINLASDNINPDRSEITLLDKSKILNDQIQIINQKKADTENIVNVISDFPDKGGLVNDFFSKKKVLIPIVLILLTFTGLLLLALNRFLKNYGGIKKSNQK